MNRNTVDDFELGVVGKIVSFRWGSVGGAGNIIVPGATIGYGSRGVSECRRCGGGGGAAVVDCFRFVRVIQVFSGGSGRYVRRLKGGNKGGGGRRD